MPVSGQPLCGLEFWGPVWFPPSHLPMPGTGAEHNLGAPQSESSPGCASYSLNSKFVQRSEPQCPHLQSGSTVRRAKLATPAKERALRQKLLST